MTFSNMEFEEA